ncbi:MAG: flagellar filament capping protein FliD [Maioricimonas sp. JB049]
MPTIDGLITGIDTESIIQGLLQIQQNQIDLLQSRKTKVLTEQTAFRGLEAQLVSLRSQAGRLNNLQGNVFQQRSVSVSDEGAVIATANRKAAVGTYQIRINQLAAAHQVASQGFSDDNAAVTEGTFSLRVGDRPESTITVDSSNNTLQGFVDAINSADAGVTASIVRDGSGSSTPYRILLSSRHTGADNVISVTSNLAASSGNATQPAFDFATPVQAAANASVSLGEGAGAITVESDTNEVEGLLSGVKLNLLSADASKPVVIDIRRDSEAAVTALQDFVDTYNALMDFVDEQVRYNPESDVGGVLLGNRSVIDIQNTIRSTVLDVVPGVSSKMNRLTALGVSVTDTGRLELNATKLRDVLSGRVEGVSPDDVTNLFALTAESSNSNIDFVLASTRTRASATPYQVDITQAAERAAVTGANVLAASTVIDSSNNTLDLTIDGAKISVTLAEGTYTEQELASQLESVINAHPEMIGREVIAGVDGSNRLTLTSASYGSVSQVTIRGGSAVTDLGLAGTENEVGKDVKGFFIVDGITEEATGSGRLLSGKLDNENTADLQLRVTLTASQVQAGVDGELTVTEGLAARLQSTLNDLLDPVDGRIQSIDDSFDEQQESIQASIDRQQTAFKPQQERLIQEFLTLETSVSQLQTTSSFLAAQLASLPTVQARK